MTRDEVMQAYDVSEHGIITSPGKFESEPVYAPHFYEFVLDGTAESLSWPDDSETDIIEIDAADKTMWPELSADTVAVAFEISESGFISCSELTAKQLVDLHSRNDSEWEDRHSDEDESED